MSFRAETYLVLMASPSDLAEEREAATEAIKNMPRPWSCRSAPSRPAVEVARSDSCFHGRLWPHHPAHGRSGPRCGDLPSIDLSNEPNPRHNTVFIIAEERSEPFYFVAK